MKRLLSVLAVLAVTVGPLPSVLLPALRTGVAGASPTPTTYTAPATIDASGATDVSDALSWWIATQTASGVPGTPNRIVLNGTYRVEYGISIGSSGHDAAHPGLPPYARNDVIVDLTNATLVQTDPTPFSSRNGVVIEPRKRWGVPVISLYRTDGITVHGGHLLSSNTLGKYSSQREAWHGVDIIGSSDVRLEGLNIEGVWADFVYINRSSKTPSRNVVLVNGLYDRNGRQGVNINAVDGLEIAGVEFRRVQRTLFNHEAGRNGSMVNVDIHDCTGSSGALGFLTIIATPLSLLHDITVRNHRLSQGHFRIDVEAGGTQRDNITLTNNSTAATNPYDRPAPLIEIGGPNAGFNGVTVQGNHDLGSGSAPALVISPLSTGVVSAPNDFVGFQ